MERRNTIQKELVYKYLDTSVNHITITLPIDEYNLYINIVGYFHFSSYGDEELFSYQPIIVEELPKLYPILKRDIYNKNTVNIKDTFLLENEKAEHPIILIEISTEPYFDFAIEEYNDNQTFKNDTVWTLVKYSEESGKHIFIIEYKTLREVNLVLTLFSEKIINYLKR